MPLLIPVSAITIAITNIITDVVSLIMGAERKGCVGNQFVMIIKLKMTEVKEETSIIFVFVVSRIILDNPVILR